MIAEWNLIEMQLIEAISRPEFPMEAVLVRWTLFVKEGTQILKTSKSYRKWWKDNWIPIAQDRFDIEIRNGMGQKDEFGSLISCTNILEEDPQILERTRVRSNMTVVELSTIET